MARFRAVLAAVVLLCIATSAHAWVADSVAEFSGVQGQNGWYYGFYNRSADPGGVYGPAADFRLLTGYSASDSGFPGQGGAWRATGSYPYPKVFAALQHPNMTDLGAYDGWAIRRWVSEVDGMAKITGTVFRGPGSYYGQGDGFGYYIYVDGNLAYSRWMASTDNTVVAYEVTRDLRAGAFVDFVAVAGSNMLSDHCGMTARVTRLALSIDAVAPSIAPSAGVAHISDLEGGGFQSGASVSLTRLGQSDIHASNVTVEGGSKITCDFDLTGAAPGLWSIVVRNPDDQTTVLTNGFAVTLTDSAPVVGCSNRSLRRPVSATAGSHYRFRVWGKVTTEGSDKFEIDDGSGSPVTIYAASYTGIADGDYAAATGSLDASGPSPALVSRPSDVRKVN